VNNTAAEFSYDVNVYNNSSFDQLFSNLRHTIHDTIRSQLDLHT